MGVAPDDPADAAAGTRESWLAARWRRIRGVFRRETLGKDALAGTILGIESVPDGLAIGLLAGVNPVAGIYAFLFGLAGAALATSSSFMAVQATGAMALIVSDTDLGTRPDPDRALFTLAMLTGVFMIIAGLLKGGRMLRFVPTAVMVGFVTAVGVNIVLGQLTNLTGYAGRGPNRLFRAIDTFANMRLFDLPTLIVGLVTIALIVVLTRTPLHSLGLVVAIVVGSGLAALFTYVFDWPVLVVGDVADVPTGLPLPVLPSLEDLVYLALPALSLAFVGLVQGAAVAAGRPERRRQAGRRLTQLHRPRGRQRRLGGVPGHAGRRLDVGVGAHRRGGRTHPPRAVHRGRGDGARHPRRIGRRLVRRDAGTRRAPHRRRGEGDQARTHQVGREDGAVADVGHGRDLRAHAHHPAAVRGARGRRARHHPVRGAAVEPAQGPPARVPRRGSAA